MPSTTGGRGGPQGRRPPQMESPPYPPSSHALGGVPNIVPDVVITAIFLFLYVVFAIIHFKILRTNAKRGHKFHFSSALFGFCSIRIITMSLRIAWACQRADVSLGIAAQIFVYVGTIILFITNWFFVQRIVRGQHPRLGWSTSYRIFHRTTLILLIVCLLVVVFAAIQQNFTLDEYTLKIDRYLQLAGQTYFAAFCFAPVLMATISLILPRRGAEKFGGGRLHINIAILVIAAAVLSAGAIFRCVTSWLPPVALRTTVGRPIPAPWYFSTACFYVFNFLTELYVVIFYALMRVDLRFHIPNGSKKPGDYSRKRNSRYSIPVIGNEKHLKRASGPVGGIFINHSSDTLQEYEGSLFDDTRTLADSLRHPSSVLEVDPKSGNWKIKRISQATSIASLRHSNGSEPSLWSPDRDTYVADDAPPVPDLPTNWPLRESQLPRGSVAVMEHQNRRSRSHSGRSMEFDGHAMSRVDMTNAIAEAIAKLEANSETNKSIASSPPGYDTITPISPRSVRNSELPILRAYHPDSNTPQKQTYVSAIATASTSASASTSDLTKKYTPRPESGPALPRKYEYTPTPGPGLPAKKHDYFPSPSPELPRKKHNYTSSSATAESSDLPRKFDYRASATGKEKAREPEVDPTVSPTTDRTASFDTAEEAFERFSFEAPLRPGDEGYEGSARDHDSEWSYEEYEKKRLD